MLGLDAHLESDLGIDSIKRMEIVGAFRRTALPSLASPPPAFMEEVSAARTLRAILDGADKLRGHAETGTRPSQASPPPHGRGVPDTADRCVGTVTAAPPGAHRGGPLMAGAVVLTDDGGGTARELAIALGSQNRPVVCLGAEDLLTAGHAARALDRARGDHGAIAALVHLLPLRDAPAFPGLDAREWSRWADPELKGLLFLLQGLAPELASARDGSAAVIALSQGGGDFGGPEGSEARCPWRGGLAGLLKTAAREWPGARFRALDVDDVPEPAAILGELDEDGPVEVGRRAGVRLTVRAVRDELPEEAPPAPAVELTRDSVVLVTGGARGITGEVAREVAGRTGARLVLLGRTPAPAEESPLTAPWPEGVDLRRAVLRQLTEGGRAAPAKEVEARVQALLREREVRQTLDDLGRSASSVEYIPCDVRRAEDVESVVRDVRARLGGVDAVIHGAGVIEDCALPDKTAASFDRVLDTKVHPMLALARALDPERLKLVVLFSSVAGFVGNPGQGDYAAANEVLNRMARRLRDLWPGKVVAMNWGPWGGAGMVKPGVADQFAARGIGLVTVAAGRRAVWQEVEHTGSGDVRVVIGAGPWVVEPGGPADPAGPRRQAEPAVAYT